VCSRIKKLTLSVLVRLFRSGGSVVNATRMVCFTASTALSAIALLTPVQPHASTAAYINNEQQQAGSRKWKNLWSYF
jgi:hypothetical protein